MTPLPENYLPYRVGRIFGEQDVQISRNKLRVLGFDDKEQSLFWDGYATGQKAAIIPQPKGLTNDL